MRGSERFAAYCASTSLVWLFSGSLAGAQDSPRVFAGIVSGIATLSADARSVTSSSAAAVSQYKPENGPAVNVFGGAHVHEFLTVQANYVWNRNDLALLSASFSGAAASVNEDRRSSSQHAIVGDLQVYFRERRSHVRPYLSVGIGVARLASRARAAIDVMPGETPRPVFTSTHALLRVAVGMDIALSSRSRFRYSFSESLSRNPISRRLVPAGERNLANFQNLFGLVVAL